jgi:hypothetical protein
MAIQKHLYVDFKDEPRVPFVSSAGAIMTSAAGQTDFMNLRNGEYLELYQSTGNAGFVTPTISAAGWCFPVAAGNIGIEITGGIEATRSPSFIVGTDEAFFVRLNAQIPVLAPNLILGVGFRELTAYVVTDTEARLQTAYDEKAWIGTSTAGAAWKTHTSLATVDVSTTLAHAGAVATEYVDLTVKVSAAGAVTYLIGTGTTEALSKTNAAADANAVAFTLTSADVFVPFIVIANANGGAPNDAIINEFECGYQN